MNTEKLFCSSCQLDFQDETLYKTHYKSDFHRYNITRKLIGLAPVAESIYQDKFSQIIDAKQLVRKDKVLFKCCTKEFKSDKTYQTHLTSKSHKDFHSKTDDKSNPLQSTQWRSEICLFCSKPSQTVVDNIEHMKLHGFFIRERNYVCDMEGLLKTLAEQINKNFTCLHCFQTFKCEEATKSHMMDKGHCFMPQQEYKLLSKYYDFEEKLNAIIQDQQQSFPQLQGQQQFMIKQNNEQDEEGDWEDDEDDDDKESEDSDWQDDQNVGGSNTEEELKKKKLKQQLKQIAQYKAKLKKNGELQLPSGKILGHRQYRNYYNQHHIQAPKKSDSIVAQLMGRQQPEENQLAVQNEQLMGQLNNFIQKKNMEQGIRSVRLGLKQNKIIRRWLRKSC